MLVLSRRVGEKVIIDHDIVVTIVRVDRDKIRLGFEAPLERIIHRQEVYDRIHQSQPNQQVKPDPPAAPPRSGRARSARRSS